MDQRLQVADTINGKSETMLSALNLERKSMFYRR